MPQSRVLEQTVVKRIQNISLNKPMQRDWHLWRDHFWPMDDNVINPGTFLYIIL